MGVAAISWKSKKQTLNAQSSMEFEFFALTIARHEAEWLCCFLRDLLLKELQCAIAIYFDKQAMNVVTVNSLFNKKSGPLI